MQPTQLAVAHSSSSLLTPGFSPCASGTPTCTSGNNGNLQSQTITMPGLSLTQNYTYDHPNRLTNATETGGTGWAQGYGYDVTGNRWVSPAMPGPLSLTNATPQAQGWFDNCVGGTGPTCSGGTWSQSANNQKLPSEGWTYDGAGNVTQVGSSAFTFTYDAENRQVPANVNGSVSTYAYDGNGLRVSKSVPTGLGTNTTVSVYDASGNEAAQYPSFVPTSNCDTPTCYVTMDHLGSTRMLTDSAGNVQRRYDFLPFGQELGAGIGSRTTAMGYLAAPDGLGPKFTGQDRDQETSLDWFQVRSMSGAAGRFQSVDPGNAGADAGDPQTWNGYSYVGNNPMSFTDPSGMGEGDGWGGLIVAGLIIAGEEIAGVFGSGGSPATLPPSVVTPSDPIMGSAGGMGNASGSFCSGSNPLVLCATASGGSTVPGGFPTSVSELEYWWTIERHHLLPQAERFQKYFAKFDIEEYTVNLPRWLHRLRPNGIHTGEDNWNAAWDDFFRENPRATPREILKFKDKLIEEFGLTPYITNLSIFLTINPRLIPSVHNLAICGKYVCLGSATPEVF